MCPFEFVATPMPSPMYTLGGIFMKSRTTSYLMSGASIAFGSSLAAAAVRVTPPGPITGAGDWAPPPAGGPPCAARVTLAAIATAAATELMARLFIGHLKIDGEMYH